MMTKVKKWLKSCFPTKATINNSSNGVLKKYSNHRHIWSFNCYSTSVGTAIGLFIAFLPLPFQMIIAGFLAILARANLPIAIVMTWITNPFTFIPINYFVYWVGKKVLGQTENNFQLTHFTWKFDTWSQFWTSISNQISQLGEAYLIGLPIVAITAALLGYLVVRIAWYFTHKR